MAHSKPANKTVGKRKRYLLLYPYYWPHYKAGGPVQSLFNIVSYFKDEGEFYLISHDRDIDGEISQLVEQRNKWIKGPNAEFIYFTSFISPLLVFNLLRQVKPDVVFINGLFNITTTFPGLLWAKIFNRKTIISPRGMLQQWALNRGGFKKMCYLRLFKVFLNFKELWHATDEQEKADILKIFGIKADVYLAGNIPRKVQSIIPVSFPDVDKRIKLVFLSLINPNKNLHLIIEAVQKCTGRYTLDIYGPVIDKEYWDFCQNKIVDRKLISYKGSVPAWRVGEILPQYHFFVLPTAGENFGHAIFDALASGVPVIVTGNTPWKNLEDSSAGFYVDLRQPESLYDVLKTIASMAPAHYNLYRKQSLVYATKYWNSKDYRADYSFLLN